MRGRDFELLDFINHSSRRSPTVRVMLDSSFFVLLGSTLDGGQSLLAMGGGEERSSQRLAFAAALSLLLQLRELIAAAAW